MNTKPWVETDNASVKKVVQKSEWFDNGEERILTVYEDGSAVHEKYIKKYKKWLIANFPAKNDTSFDVDEFKERHVDPYYTSMFIFCYEKFLESRHERTLGKEG